MQRSLKNGIVRVTGAGRFSPVHTFECGQCFRWTPDEAGWYIGVAGGKAANVRVDNGDILISCSLEDFDGFWRSYLDLDRNYDLLKDAFCIDDFTSEAVEFGSGMRILRQEPFETLISFILSQCNNIKRIRGIVHALSKLSGKEIDFHGKLYYAFPEPSELARLSLSDLQPLKAGYRAPYILEAAKAVLSGEVNFTKIGAMETGDARREIMKLYGVGEKVANCFLLFGMGKLDAFPRRCMDKKSAGIRSEYKRLPFWRVCGNRAAVYLLLCERNKASFGKQTENRKRVSHMRMRKKKNLIPRMERCSDYLVTTPQDYKGKWSDALGKHLPVYLEIGCGKGRFIIETAKESSNGFFLAMEREENVLITALEAAKLRNCENVLFLNDDATDIESIFDKGELKRIYINFCDPWRPRKQAKRRLTHKNYLSLYKTVLATDGEIHFKTDNKDLFEFSIKELSEFGFSLKNVTYDLHESGMSNIRTEYEAMFASQGMRIYKLEAFL